MAEDPTDIASRGLDELYRGKNVLGNPSELRLAGTGALPGGGGAAAALPAPSGPGGISGGFLGGGVGGRGPGGNMAGKAGELIGDVIKRSLAGSGEDLGTRGNVGGEGTQQDSQTSLSDRLRGGDLTGLFSNFDVSKMVGTPSTYGGQIGAEGGAEGLRGLGQMTPGAGEAIQTGPGAFSTAPGGVDLGGAGASLAGMLTGPALSYLANLATSTADPELRAAISGLVQAAAPALAPAVTGAISGVAGGTGALAGAAGGLAAAGPGLIAAAPMAAMQIATSINGMLAQQALMDKLTGRFKDLQQNMPGQIAALQTAPGLLEQLNSATTPEQAAGIYKQLQDIQDSFQGTGMEDFLQHGYTRAFGDPAGGGWEQANFPQGPEIFQGLVPSMQALDIGRIRAADIAARGGQPIPGFNIREFQSLSPAFMEAMRPSATDPAGQLGRFLGPTGMGLERGQDYTGAALPEGFMQEVASPELLRFAGLPTEGGVPGQPGRQETVEDLFNYLRPSGGGSSFLFGGNPLYQTSEYGLTNMPIYRKLEGLQPGQYESGLAGLFGQYGGAPAGLAQYGFGTGAMPVTPQQQQAGQLATNALGPGHGAFDALLSDEQKRAMGLL